MIDSFAGGLKSSDSAKRMVADCHLLLHHPY